MKRWTCSWLVAALAALCTPAAFGQVLAAPSPENTLTVGVTGTAESPADWVEVNLAVEGRGVNAQEALAICQEACRNAVNELTALGIPADAIRCAPPDISAGGLAEMMGAPPQDEEQGKFVVSRSLVVRLTEIDPETVYEDICRIIDVAADAGAGPKAPQQFADVMSSGGIVTFGVNDPKPLRAQAIADGLEQAKEVADVVAASAGKKTTALSAVAIQEYGSEGLLAMFSMVGFPPTTGRGVYRVMLTVTYQLE